MLSKSSIAILVIAFVVAVASSIASQPTPKDKRDTGLRCWLYTGKYHNFPTAEDGCTTLPRSVVWEAAETTQHPDLITLRLRDGNFLPLVSQMDLETAKKLHEELGKMIVVHEAGSVR
jgi:hypothetical protein